MNLVFVILIVGSYLFIRRGSRQPVQLNLKNPREPSGPRAEGVVESRVPAKAPDASGGIRNPSRVAYRPRNPRPGTDRVDAPGAPKPVDLETPGGRSDDNDFGADLNVLFQWNGHTWDAYEVLGIPAGSSPAAVKAAYERLSKSVAPDSLPFLQAAVNAIAGALR